MIGRENAQRYGWGEGCDGWWLVRSEGLAVIEERMPAGTSERRHRHGSARQFFYVLSGELTMKLGESEERLSAGQGIEIAPGIAHQAMNRSAGEVRFLVVSQPPSHGDREDL